MTTAGWIILSAAFGVFLVLNAFLIFLLAVVVRSRRTQQTIVIPPRTSLAQHQASLSPPFRFRAGTNDQYIWQEVAVDNAYGLPASCAGQVWIDCGAHIGAFSAAALMRGADYVYALEPDMTGPGGGNLCSLQRNLSQFAKAGRAKIMGVAISDRHGDVALCRLSRSGQASSVAAGKREGRWDDCGTAKGITLGTIIDIAKRERAGKGLRVKLSIMGSESAVLQNADLSGVDEVVGQWWGEPGELTNLFSHLGMSVTVMAHETAGRWAFRADHSGRTPVVLGVPMPAPVKRNLLYYIYPVRGGGVWQWNVEQIKKRLGLFNGRRIVAISTDRYTDSEEAVRQAFGDNAIEFLSVRNDPGKQEMAAFYTLWSMVESHDPSEITFYAHAKGVSKRDRAGHPIPIERNTSAKWAGMMYESCLDYYPIAESLLRKHVFVGSFKKYGGCLDGTSNWHYSGTYYWARNAELFRRHWKTGNGTFYASEGWPAAVCPSSLDGACIFFECTCQSILYHSDQVDAAAAEFEEWKEKYKQHRGAIA